MARTLVAVGIVKLVSMFATTRAAGPLSFSASVAALTGADGAGEATCVGVIAGASCGVALWGTGAAGSGSTFGVAGLACADFSAE